jgi:hypothetical protein
MLQPAIPSENTAQTSPDRQYERMGAFMGYAEKIGMRGAEPKRNQINAFLGLLSLYIIQLDIMYIVRNKEPGGNRMELRY